MGKIVLVFLTLLGTISFNSLWSQVRKSDTLRLDSTFQIKFDDGRSTNFRINQSDPDLHSRWNATICFFDFRSDKWMVGPLAIEPIFQFHHKSLRLSSELRFMWTPMDIRNFRDLEEDYNLSRLEFDWTFKLALFGNKRLNLRRTRISFRNPYDSSVGYRIKFKWPQRDQFVLRTGAFYLQRSLDEQYVHENIEVNGVEVTQDENLQGMRQLMTCIGISKLRKRHIDCYISMFGRYQRYLIGEIYADFIISPFSAVLGSQENRPVSDTYDGSLDQVGKLSINSQYFPFGGRVGFTRRSTMLRFDHLGWYWGMEFCFYPGPLNYNREFTGIKWGLMFL